MALRFIHKTKSSTFAELLADRGHPGPKIIYAKHNAYLDVLSLETSFSKWENKSNKTRVINRKCKRNQKMNRNSYGQMIIEINSLYCHGNSPKEACSLYLHTDIQIISDKILCIWI
jgi:hypothetical protein